MIASSGQSQVSVNVHIGSPPSWGPSGYDHVRYYYLPDVDAYYDVHTAMFIYISGNHWIRRNQLPARYENYNLNRGYKVVLKNYRGNAPYNYYKQHKMKYAKENRGVNQGKYNVRNNNEKNNNDRYNKKNKMNNGNDQGKMNKSNNKNKNKNK